MLLLLLWIFFEKKNVLSRDFKIGKKERKDQNLTIFELIFFLTFVFYYDFSERERKKTSKKNFIFASDVDEAERKEGSKKEEEEERARF